MLYGYKRATAWVAFCIIFPMPSGRLGVSKRAGMQLHLNGYG